jgi:hypothetical protein
LAAANGGANAGPAIAPAQPEKIAAPHLPTITSDALITANASSSAWSELVDCFIGNRRGDDHAAADVDADMRRRPTFRYGYDLALELVASAELHSRLLQS